MFVEVWRLLVFYEPHKQVKEVWKVSLSSEHFKLTYILQLQKHAISYERRNSIRSHIQ